MRIIIAGAGEVGFHLAKQLSNKEHDITIIDLDETQIEKSSSASDVMSIRGSSTSIRILKEARIKETDLVVAVTSNESVNYLIELPQIFVSRLVFSEVPVFV